MDELVEWIQFHPKTTSSVQINHSGAPSSFDMQAPLNTLLHIANSRKICIAWYSLPPKAALWNATDSLQPLNFPIATTSLSIVTARAQGRDARPV